MGTEKRERQKAGRQARIEAALAEQQRAERRSRMIRFGIIFLVLVAVVAVVTLRSSDENDTETAAPSTTAGTVPAPASTTAAPSTTGAPVEPVCPPAEGTAERNTQFSAAPPMCIDPAKSYTAVLATSMGDITMALDPAKAPQTVNNFVFLARNHYYDGTVFHRVVPGFVVQGGDPTATGTGGPGYTVPDELPASVEDYTPGAVAMANSGPDTNGSQFFIWTGPQSLGTPSYSLFGQVTEGYDVVEAISGTPLNGQRPTTDVTIESVTVTES